MTPFFLRQGGSGMPQYFIACDLSLSKQVDHGMIIYGTIMISILAAVQKVSCFPYRGLKYCGMPGPPRVWFLVAKFARIGLLCLVY